MIAPGVAVLIAKRWTREPKLHTSTDCPMLRYDVTPYKPAVTPVAPQLEPSGKTTPYTECGRCPS
jgi:hypothetical protein